ncbi:helix-hairpin-helix domain-containing protein [Zobellella sp. DQSA1]|uniref:helix-hairpin-helix domain-containing protein n=1 Tax=Zobellella sp. DQSA1 TaxID=3342386 RepID=UPI0035C16B93
MAFSHQEKTALLALKGVGPTVIQRLEQLGIHSLDELARHEVDDITGQVAAMLGSSCWKNSPQARASIAAAIALARSRPA